MKKYTPLLIFAAFAIMYMSLAQRGLSWQDSGEYQARVLTGDIAGFTGLARAHPIYICAANAWSACFPPSLKLWAISSFSGIGAALSLGLLFTLVKRFTSSSLASFLAVIPVGLSHMMWWLSSVAEVYTWSLAAMGAELLLLLLYLENGRRSSLAGVALFLVNGLHFGIHNFALIDLAVLAGVVAVTECRRRAPVLALGTFGAGMAFWLIGASPILSLAFKNLSAGASFSDTLLSLLFGNGYEARVLSLAPANMKIFLANMALAAISFANPLWLGCFARRTGKCASKPGSRFFAYSVLALLILHFVFWIRYFVPDQATFVLPTLYLAAFFAGLGFARAQINAWKSIQLLALGAFTSVFVPMIAAQALQLGAFKVQRARELPFRNETAYWILPWKVGEDSAERFVLSAAKAVADGDAVIADTTVSGLLQAAAALGKFPRSCKIIPVYEYHNGEGLDLLLQRYRNVYLVSPVKGYTPDDGVFLSGRYRYAKKGVLFGISAGGVRKREGLSDGKSNLRQCRD